MLKAHGYLCQPTCLSQVGKAAHSNYNQSEALLQW